MHPHVRRTAIAIALGFVASVTPGTGAHAKQYGPWSEAAPVSVNSLTTVNSPATEGCPIEAPDGQSFYFMSTRDGGDQDIWVAPRTRDGGLGEPQLLPEPVNSNANDFCPTPLRGKSLLFVSNRGGTDAYGTAACGGGDLYVTRQSPATGQWAEPRNLGCSAQGGPNSPDTEFGPSVVETDAGTFLYFSTAKAPGSAAQRIVMSSMRPDGTFAPGLPVGELNSEHDDRMPNVRKDGLEVVFASTRPDEQGNTDSDIWSSTRTSTSEPWSAPVNLGPAVNGPGPESRPSLSWHGTRLYFGRSGDIYVSNR